MTNNVVNIAENNKNARRLISIIEEFRKLDPEIQAQTITLFLLVVARPGITMKELVQQTGLASSSVSRNISALGERHRNGEPGHGLVRAYEDPQDRRTKRVDVTAQGRRVYETLITILAGGRPE
ncbi:winged helix-turn-helix transcriptional regulator [Ensifer sp. ENS10]|uniref:MarR family winged helix-turn-helix transcriptional regulator n=1 Tax=Ensifer sp. ENS10 TaxID=2769286 RepID=UPI00177EA8FE|nr:MarR family winged helix-turn-helix transcriptional regulator [Ensifer sp. ENS10]MBD9511939.1 winged helix-turn-helix transcriptional regulator [Ensifer sp. ENS10]